MTWFHCILCLYLTPQNTFFFCTARVITTVIRHISALQLFPLCTVIVIHQCNISISSARIVIIQQLGVIELGTRRGTSESNQPHCSDLCLSQHHCYGGHSTWLVRMRSHIPLSLSHDALAATSFFFLSQRRGRMIKAYVAAVKAAKAIRVIAGQCTDYLLRWETHGTGCDERSLSLTVNLSITSFYPITCLTHSMLITISKRNNFVLILLSRQQSKNQRLFKKKKSLHVRSWNQPVFDFFAWKLKKEKNKGFSFDQLRTNNGRSVAATKKKKKKNTQISTYRKKKMVKRAGKPKGPTRRWLVCTVQMPCYSGWSDG